MRGLCLQNHFVELSAGSKAAVRQLPVMRHHYRVMSLSSIHLVFLYDNCTHQSDLPTLVQLLARNRAMDPRLSEIMTVFSTRLAQKWHCSVDEAYELVHQTIFVDRVCEVEQLLSSPSMNATARRKRQALHCWLYRLNKQAISFQLRNLSNAVCGAQRGFVGALYAETIHTQDI